MLAQMIALAFAPVLSRLFTPQSFGAQSLFLSVVGVVVVVLTLKLDVALVIASDEQDEADILATISALAAIGMTMILGITALFGERIADSVGFGGEIAWTFYMIPMLSALMMTQVATGVLTARDQFSLIASTNIVTQASFVFSALGVWWAGLWLPTDNAEGLIVARVVAQLVTAAVLGWALSRLVGWVRWPGLDAVRRVWARHHQFLIFNTPYSLIGTLGRDMPLYVLAIFSTTTVVGLYGLARTLLLVPTGLLAASLRQVFYREAAQAKGTQRLEDLTVSLLKATALTTAPLFAFVTIWGDVLFATVFGGAWANAGVFAMILAPASWMSALTSWPDRLFEVSGRQDASFKVQIAFDIACALTTVAALAMGYSPAQAIGFYSIAHICQHTVYLFAAFSVSGMSGKRLALTLARGWCVYAIVTVIFLALRWVPGVSALVIAGGCAILSMGVSGLYAIRSVLELTTGAAEGLR